jgi:hypothetical protein
MKTRIAISSFLMLLVLVYFYSQIPAKENKSQSTMGTHPSKFRISMTNIGSEPDFDFISPLNCNLWHKYMGSQYIGNKWYPKGWTVNDLLFTDIGGYKNEVLPFLDNIKNHNYLSYSGRPKIDMLTYAQRSDYQCEIIDVPSSDNGVDWWYAFDEHPVGEPSDDNGILGRKCLVSSTQGAGIVVKGLRANREQVDNRGGGFWDGDYSWYIKPMVKVDQNFVNNPNNSEISLFNIKVRNYNGGLIINEDIKAKYFWNDSYYYDGNYKEEFRFPENNNLLKIENLTYNEFNPTNTSDGICYMDIEVYWYKECDMWIDYVRVDNEWADRLFKHYYDDTWIEWEANQIADANTTYNFYTDEAEYNMLPAIAYLNEKIHNPYQPNLSVNSVVNMTFFTPELNNSFPGWNRRYLSNEHIASNITKWKMNEVMVDIYPMFGTKYSEINYNIPQYIPNTFGEDIQYDPATGVLAYPAPPAVYERNLDSVINRLYTPYLIQAKEIAGLMNFSKPIHIITTNQLYYSGTDNKYSQKEPTIEEMDLLNNIAVSYSAKAITNYAYWSFGNFNNPAAGYQRGVVGDGLEFITGDYIKNERHHNAYGQNKWGKACEINNRLQLWGDYLVSFDESQSNSYNYRILSERNDLIANTYFSSASTFIPGGAMPICSYPDINLPMENLTPDCQDSTYLQIATFKNPNESNTEYFMVVNRRCSPEHQTPELSGLRYVRVRLKAGQSQFSSANSWTVINLGNNTTVGSVNAGQLSSLNLSNDNDLNNGWFKPGEGRLYKMVPTVESGGSLSCDEYIQSGTFNCQDTIFTNGYNLTIGFGTTINFSDSGCIVVNGGSFTCGDVSQPTHERNIIFKGISNNNWSGFTFYGCDLVNINSAQFQNVKGPAENTNYAVKMINCNTFNINNCTFTNADPQKSGAIEANYSGSSMESSPNLCIAGNTFNMNSSDKTIVSIIANAESSVPVMLDNNVFTSNSNSATAMYLAFVSGVEIGGNAIVGYNKGIEMHYSNIDVIGNSITTTTGNNGAKGIDAGDFSSVNLSTNGTLRTGGLNIFDNAGQNINNIYVNSSYFYLEKGNNIFSIISNSNSYHLKGNFPGDGDSQFDETSNCFRVDNVAVVESNLPVKDVKWSDSEGDVDFSFFSYDCSTGSECNEMVVDMGNSVYDTICIIPGGSGGGVPSVQTVTPKKMYDSLCVLMRLRNFPQAKVKCYELLNTFPDSTQSLNAISKLYYLAVSLDTSTVNITDCKTFLNTLILNHPNNLSLVRKCNYYVQKCKVRLKQYQSAMTGFQQIMQQNPYSYEALLASWDYAATHLLDSLNGHSGGTSNDQLSRQSGSSTMDNVQLQEQDINYSRFNIEEFSSEDIFALDYDVLFEKIDNLLFNDDDKDAFTKEQRESISTSVVTALDNSKKKSKNHIETLTKKSEQGNSDATVELKVIKTLKEVVKIKKPKTIFEHIKSVNKDIQKLNTVKNETVKNVTSVIPQTYNLSQNYPNPFNPVTKINYELPNDGKVKLVIYDILGREIKTLVNELKQAGRYTIEFNGTQFASGVYFYRIQVEGGKTYTAVKKMVLIK